MQLIHWARDIFIGLSLIQSLGYLRFSHHLLGVYFSNVNENAL